MKFINSKPLDSDRATEIKITNRIDNAISKLPSKIIPRVNKVGTVFVVDENSFDYTTLKVKKK
jgi:hypothetical protein